MKKSLIIAGVALGLLCSCRNTDSKDRSTDSAADQAQITPVNVPDIPDTDDEDSEATPVTQYSFVDTGEFGPCLRTSDKVAAILRNFGFEIETSPKSNADDMSKHLAMQATRVTGKKRTVVRYYQGEDNEVRIHFATKRDCEEFRKSLEASKYTPDEGIYSHPLNDMSKVYVKIEGLEAKIIQPFEMLPSDF